MDYKNVLENQIKELENLNKGLVKRPGSEEKACQVALTIKSLVETINTTRFASLNKM